MIRVSLETWIVWVNVLDISASKEAVLSTRHKSQRSLTDQCQPTEQWHRGPES